ncbi:MAG: dTMP kinase, partial [Thermoplasmata archaeon]|nr:dTMP kinase [Thermoplasmata archaeon]
MVRYIVLEGIDGSGKPEVAKRLSALTPDYMLTREPTERLGPVIMVNDSPWADVLLFAADRALLMEDVNRWLGEG